LNSFNRTEFDELSYLNNLIKEYSELHYRIEDGFITLYLERNIEPKRFREGVKRVSIWIKSRWFRGVDYTTLVTLINIASKIGLSPRRILSSKKGITITFLKAE
jgi:hypothetical protein